MKDSKKYEFIGESDEFFTKGNTYTAYPFGGKFQVDKDDEGDHHGMTSRQMRKWFKLKTTL